MRAKSRHLLERESENNNLASCVLFWGFIVLLCTSQKIYQQFWEPKEFSTSLGAKGVMSVSRHQKSWLGLRALDWLAIILILCIFVR